MTSQKKNIVDNSTSYYKITSNTYACTHTGDSTNIITLEKSTFHRIFPVYMYIWACDLCQNNSKIFKSYKLKLSLITNQ